MGTKERAEEPIGGDYQLQYRNDLDGEAEWLRGLAALKVDSIESLLERNSMAPRSVLEMGCGTGAVVRECQRRHIGQRLVGLDYSEEALNYLRDHSRGIDTIHADLRALEAPLEETFDVVILSHVLEHLDDPDACLRAIVRQASFSHLILEVPLEDLVVNNLIARVRGRERGPAAHVQFFNVRSFRALLTRHRLTIVDDRLYAPVLDLDTIWRTCVRPVRAGQGTGRWPRLRFVRNALTQHCLPRWLGPLKKRLQYAHYAVLCQKDETQR